MGKSVEEIQQMKTELDTASDSYYNGAELIMTDEEFDALLSKYESFSGEKYSTLTAPKKGKKLVDISHKFPNLVGTLDKAFNMKEVNEWLDSKIENDLVDTLIASEKFDGNSVVLSFNKKGNLESALTRGKEGKGLDLTDFFSGRTIDINEDSLLSECFSWDDNDELGIKCEALITYDDFEIVKEKMGKSFANPRSLVAGLLNSDDGYLYKDYVSLAPIKTEMKSGFVPHDRHTDVLMILDELSNSESLGSIAGNFFVIEQQQLTEAKKEIAELYKEYIDFERENLPYMIDGLVLELGSITDMERLGRRNDRNNYDIAIKFPYLSKKSTITDIEFYYSKTGRVTPVAVFKPLEFNGAICDHVSLANYARFNELQLGVGSRVIIEYHADVMSYLVNDPTFDNSTITPIEFVDTCKFCGKELFINDNETFVFCNNPECSCNLKGKIVNWFTKLNIKGIKESTVDRLIDGEVIESIQDLYTLTKEDIMKVEGFKSKSAENIIKAINDRKTMYDYELFGSLMFTNIGHRKTKEIFKVLRLEDILNLEDYSVNPIFDDLTSISGISEIMATNFIDGVESNITIIKYIIENLDVVSYQDSIETSSMDPLKIVFTGYRDKELQEKLELDGHKVTGSVSKNTDIVITKDKSANSSKINKARELGILVMEPSEFSEYYNDLVNK